MVTLTHSEVSHDNEWRACRRTHEQFGTTYRRERTRQGLHRLGFRLRQWHPRHLKAKPEEQAAFMAGLSTLWVDWPG
jgi:transposase